MWKKLLKTKYFLSFKEYDVLLTDFITLWSINFTEKCFLDCLVASNSALHNIDEKILLEKGRSMLTNPGLLKSSTSIREDGNILLVSLRMSCGFPLKLDLKLPTSSKEIFFLKVTQPLTEVVQDLYISQQELRRLLLQKDQEIQEYKCEGGEIALRHLKTIPFCDDTHLKHHQTYNKSFGTDDVPKHILEMTVDISRTIIETLKKEPNPVAVGVCKSACKTEKVSLEPTINPPMKSEPVTTQVKLEPTKTEIKLEPASESCSQTVISPRKKQKRKLNI